MKSINIKFYPLPDGNFVVSYSDPLRRERIQKTFDTESIAQEFYTALRSRKPVKQEKKSFSNCTIEELVEVYLEEAPAASLRKSPQLIRDFLEQFALFKPCDIDEIKLRSFYTRQKLEYDYTNHSLSTRKYQIQGFFNWMISRGIVSESPQNSIRMGKSQAYKRKPIFLKPEKVDEAIEKARLLSPAYLYPILLLVKETAAKTSDIAELKWSHIDSKRMTITFPANAKIQKRELSIPTALVAAFGRIEKVSDHVFTNLEGRPVRKDILIRELKSFQRKAGLQANWVYRDLRHSFAVNFMKAGGEISELQKIMGHWHPQFTKELYGRYKAHAADF